MDLPLILNNIGCLMTAGLGLMGLIRPNAAAAFTSIQPIGILGVSEIRATYGGFFFALGAYALYAQSAAVFVVLGVAWVGASVGRLISVAVDRSYAPKKFGGVVFEFTIGILLLFP
jgi:hypothetical protein